jgi:RimJ/RimL family protein N-acetyltransferase
MIFETNPDDYACLIAGKAPRLFSLPDTPIASPEVLKMLAGIATSIGATFTPASWLVVEGDEVVGLVSVTRLPEDGLVQIGYGVASSRQGRGNAGRAIADIVSWARRDPRVAGIVAETAVTNLASQAVLIRNGFTRVGERTDAEDGDLFCWRCQT